MKIGDLSKKTGASARSLRYYEDQHLLTSTRSNGGTRLYGADAADRVLLIQRLFAAGVSSSRILALLPGMQSTTPNAEGIARLVLKRDKVDRDVRELLEARDQFTDLILAKHLQLQIVEARAEEVAPQSGLILPRPLAQQSPATIDSRTTVPSRRGKRA